MDVKQNPLYEKGGFVYLDTHYYGGIKKYQWVTLPLAIHGVVAKTNGDVMTVNIGEDKNDPVFCVTDLLIHLSQEQLKKRADSVIEGEQLDILFASRPLEGKEKEAVKEAVLALLEKKYNMKEEGFPLSRARDRSCWKGKELRYRREYDHGIWPGRQSVCIHIPCRHA